MLCGLMKDQSHNRYFRITERQHVLWQGLTGLTSLRDFHCSALRCPEHAEARPRSFSGAVAQALWTLALGWPQLTSLRFDNCDLSSGEVSSNIKTFPGIPQLRCDMVQGQHRFAMSGFFALSDGMHSEGADAVGISPVMLRMPSDDGSQGRGCYVLHKLPQL